MHDHGPDDDRQEACKHDTKLEGKSFVNFRFAWQIFPVFVPVVVVISPVCFIKSSVHGKYIKYVSVYYSKTFFLQVKISFLLW